MVRAVDAATVGQFEPQRVVRLPRLPAAIEMRGFERDRDHSAELLRLTVSSPGQGGARNAGRKAEIVLDARRGSGLAAESALIQHEHRQAFGRGIDRDRKARGPGADHDHVVHDMAGIEFRRNAEAHTGLGIRRSFAPCRPGGTSRH